MVAAADSATATLATLPLPELLDLARTTCSDAVTADVLDVRRLSIVLVRLVGELVRRCESARTTVDEMATVIEDLERPELEVHRTELHIRALLAGGL